MNISAAGGNASGRLGAIPAPARRPSGVPANSSAVGGKLGIFFPLLLAWLFFEFGRPPSPLAMPLLISLTCFVGYIMEKDKHWTKYSAWWLVLLAVMIIDVPLAANTYAAFWTTRDMAVLFLTICLPTQALVNSLQRVRLWSYTFLAVSVYVGAFAATHAGYGPSGAAGGQDENYVAALMCMAIPFAYFGLFAEKRFIVKIMLAGSLVIFVAAIALGGNPSRGGFIGLVAVALYCLARSPRKALGLGIFAVIGIALVVAAGPTFWKEISTSGDYQAGTADTRIEIWKAGMRMWKANPILGVGPGNFRWVLGDFQTAEQLTKFGRSLGGSIIAHSMHVEMVAELGTMGLICMAILVRSTWKGLSKIVREVGTPQDASTISPELVQLRCFSDAIRAAMLAILVNGVFLSLFYYSHLWLLVAIGTAVPFIYRSLTQGQNMTEAPALATTGRAKRPGRGTVTTRHAPVPRGQGRNINGRR